MSSGRSIGLDLLVVLFGVVLAALGWALAADYRGRATWRAERTVAMFWPLQKRVNSRWPCLRLPAVLVPRTADVMKRQQIQIGRLLGLSFGLVGAGITVIGATRVISHVA